MKKLFLGFCLVLIVALFVFGITRNNSLEYFFEKDGYVIENSGNVKHYFSSNSKFVLASNKINFTNSDNDDVNVSDDTFIHYMDGSVSVFKKSSILDLSNMNTENYIYYNVYSGVVLNKSSNQYKVTYLDGQLTFTEFLVKISSNKYLIVSPNLSIKYGEDIQKVNAGYIELIYSDGNIVSLQNNELNINNISSSIQLILDDNLYIDLGTKKIMYKEKSKINLGEITIDSDDYIDVYEPPKEETSNNSNNNNGSGNGGGTSSVVHQGDFDEVASGIIDAAEIEIEQVVEENAAIKDAKFSVTDFEVYANGVNAEVSVTDEEAILDGPLYIKIIKTSTNEVVYYEQDTSGTSNIKIEVLNLVPDTNYILVLNRNYIKNNITYNKDFVQKTFVTSAIGVDATKSYTTSNTISVDVNRTHYSQVTKASYKFVDITTNEVVKEDNVEFLSADVLKQNLVFDGLDANHEYTLKFYDFVYGNTIINSTNKDFLYSYKTLKLKPTVGKTSFSVDKQNGKFVVYLNNVIDVNSGVTSYRVDVYDASNNKYVISKTSLTNNKIEFDVDGEVLSRNTRYIVYAYLVFNDNEKEYELPIGSETISVSGVSGPVVTFYPSDITWQSISGRIVIKDDNETINSSEKIYVTYQNLSVGAEMITNSYDAYDYENNSVTLPINIINLRAKDSYLFTVKAYVDYHDSEGTGVSNGYTLVDIASFIVYTEEPKKMTVSYTDETSLNENVSFYVVAQLKSADENENTSLEASTMQAIKFKLYSVNYDTSKECIAANGCFEKRYYDRSDLGYDSPYKSYLKEQYYDKTFAITPDLFDITSDQISYGQYYLEINDAYDYTDYKNKLPIVNNEPIIISANKASGSILNKNYPLNIEEVYNGDTDPRLDSTTIIGYKVTPNIASMENINIKKITYHVFDAVTHKEIDSLEVLPNSGELPTTSFTLSNKQTDKFVRGGSYYYNFDIEYVLNEKTYNEKSNDSDIVYPLKQEATYSFYISSRTETTVDINYIYEDIDDAIVDSQLHYYKNDDSDAYQSVVLEKTSGSEKTITLNFANNGTLHAYLNSQLNVNNRRTSINVINYYFSDVVSKFGSVNYYFFDGLNQTTLVLKDLTDAQRASLVGADITLTGDTKSVTFNSRTVTNGEITFMYTSLIPLQGDGEIKADIKLYYDTGYYGINTPNKGSGYALQYPNGSYLKQNNYFAFNINNFSPKDMKFTIQDIYGKTDPFDINYVLNNGHFAMDGEDNIDVKLLDYVSPTCASGDKCSFSFDEIIPSMTVNYVTGEISTVNFRGTITGFNEDIRDKMIVNIRAYNSLDDITNKNPFKSYSFTLEELDSTVVLDNLLPDRTYYFEIDYEVDGKTHGFYFNNNNSNVYNPTAETTDDVGITSAYSKYTYTSAPDYGRNLSLYYNLGITSGYTGIKYQLLDSKGTIVNDITIETDLIKDISSSMNKVVDIFEKIQANKNYKVRIIPYLVTEDGSTIDLKSKDVNFKFYINVPSINVNVLNEDGDSYYDVSVFLRDYANAMGSNKTFTVYLADDNGDRTVIGTGEENSYIKFNNVECDNAVCYIIVEYAYDNLNTGNYSLKTYTYTINTSSLVSTGNIVVESSTSSDTINLAFIQSYRLTSVNNISYSIYNSVTGELAGSNDGFTPNWITGENDYDPIRLQLSSSLDSGYYIIQMQFYEDEEMVANASIDYIKS